MIPAGYMAKKIVQRPEWLKADAVADIFSVSGCTSPDFADYITYWKHNTYWFFDSPNIIQEILAKEEKNLDEFVMLYFEFYEKEFDEETKIWELFTGDEAFSYNVQIPTQKLLMGYDFVSYTGGTMHTCSPLSCNGLAERIPTNTHCLLHTFEEAMNVTEHMSEEVGEDGPYRIVAVYAID